MLTLVDSPKERPNLNKCYECIHRRELDYSAHSSCVNYHANIVADRHGWRSGWFIWPINFDPTWIVICDGFTTNT